MRKKAKRAIPKLAGPLTSGGFPAQPVDAKKQIGKRFPKGKLFSDAEWDAFKELSSTPEGRTWLNASGMLTHGEIEQYLSNDNPERFRGFHLLHKPSKVVMASYVSRQMNGGEDGKRFEGTPPAAIALSMEARHTTDPARKEELTRQIDQGIANEWVKTFAHTEPNADTIKAMDQSAVLAPRTLKETLTRADIKTLPTDEALARHRQSIEVLKNIFHLLQAGAEIYDAGSKKHVPLQGVPVAKILSHGGRVNIQVPKGSPPYALTEFLGITDKNGNPTTGVFKRDFGTHHMALSWGQFKEEGGHFAAVKSALDDTELYGMNPAIGGLGLKDFNGDIILPDGAHGHVFIGYRPPKPGRRGALQIGMETTGPGAPSTVGYVHNARSTEKTANPVSSVGGLKQDKIGDEKGKNARTVDLRKLGDDWVKTLKDRADQFEHDFKENPTEAIKDLVGPREIPPQETQHTAPLASDSSDDSPDDAPDDSSDAGSDRSERGSRGGDRRGPPGDAASDPKRGAQDPGQGSSDQRPRGNEQAPKGDEPREMPGDAPEQMTAKTPETASPRPEAGTTQSAPGKAPERPGQPQPETTSQPHARGPGSPATVITTGMKTPAGSPEASVQGSAAASATPDPGTLSSRDDESVEDDIENTTDPVVNVLSDDYVHGSNDPEDGDDSEGDDSEDEGDDDSDDEGDDSDDEGDDSDDEGDDSDDEGDDSDDEGDDDSDDEGDDDSDDEGDDDSDDEGDDDSDDEGDDDSDDEGDDDSDDEGDDDSDDEGEIENTTDLVINALPDDYVHDSMVTFDPTNVPRPLASPKPTQAGIERILERWGFSDDVFFKRDLGIDGLTRPGEDPDIGPGPFEGTVFPAGGFGVPVTLPPELVELRVALTIAHELSHGNQYDNLDLIDLEGREDEIDRLPPPERDAHQTAFERQKAALEVVGYQSEIVNLERFRQMLNDDEARVYHDGLQAMEDQARTRRDEFFEQLTPEQQAIFIQDGIEAVLEDIQRGLDVKFFRNNAPDADEEDAGDEDQSRDDEDDSDDERKDDSDDERKDGSDDERKDGSDDEGDSDSDDEREDDSDSDDEGEDDSDEGEDDSDGEDEDDSDEGEDDSDDEGEGEDDSDDEGEGEDDSDDEGEGEDDSDDDDDSEDHNGDRAGPSQRPQSGGQPRPETTSQPPAQRSATPATAITTGMQAPTRPPASTKVGWLGKKLGTGGHGFGGMISNEGADQREQALADQYALQIGPDEDTGGAHFSHKMLDHIEKALGDLPPEHVTGSPTLRKIIRDISSEQAASAYDELTDTINIVNPPKVPTFIYSRLNRRWNWQRKRMDRGAIRDYDGVNKEQDRALGITEGRHVMGGTSDVLANGSLIKWTMRHEIGHSIDKLIDWKGNLASDPRFGGWKVHSDTRDTEEVARAILDKAGITDDEANSETDGVSLLQRFASFLHAPSRRKDMTPLEDFPDDAASEDPGLKKKLEKAVDTVKFAMAQPWTLDDGGASRLEVDGRIYQVDHYDQWVSYSADARNNAVSNYQFSTPAEWFAETYASYYDPNPAPRAQLTQQVRDFFANDLSGLVTSGQERWERINENTRKAEEGIGPQPPQPPAGSSASPSAVSPSAVTAGMSRNITTGTPSSGSRAASPPRDATGGPQGSSPRDANGGSQASPPRDANGGSQASPPRDANGGSQARPPRDANGGSQARPPRDATRAPNDSAVLETDGAREGLGDTQAALQALIDASKTWSHPANPANKQEAKELLGDIMRSQGVDRSLVDRLAELIDAPDSLSQHEFAICALQSVLRTQLTSDLAGFARVVAAEFTGKLFDRDGKQIADFSLDNQGEHRATTSTQATDDPIQSVIRGDLPLNDAPIGNKLLQNGVKKAGAKRADVDNKGRAWSDKHVLDYLLARGLGKMLSTLAPEQYKADADYTAGVIPGYVDKTATRDKDAKGPSKKLGDLQLSADSLVTIFTSILGGDAQTMVEGDDYDVDRINDALARPEQAPFAVATFLDGNGLVKRADQSAEDPTKVEPFDKAVTSGTSSAHQVVINGKITEDGDHYVVPLHTWQQSFSIKVKKDLLPSLFPVFTYGTYLPSQSPGTNDPARSQAPKPNAWTQLTTGGGDPLGTGGHGLAGLVSNKGAAEREQALADQYELQIGPDEDADGTHFSHKMLAHIEKALSELPPTHITGSPTLRKIIRTLSSEQAASEYDEETDTINIVNPPKVPTFIYSRLNRRWDWQRKRMDRGALRDYPGVSKEQDEALGIVGRRQVMGGVSDVLANGNLLKWTIRHEVAHSIDKLVDWRSLAHEDRFGGWQEHADSRELQAVARAIFDKAGISDDKAQQKLDDEGQSDPNGFPLIERFASLLDPELRRKDMAPLESFPAKVASTDPDLKDRLERAVRTVKVAMAQPWTLSDGGSRELEVDGRIYHVDPYNTWVSYRADARNNAVSNYQFSTPKEWFAETYASYNDPDPAPRDQLSQEVRDFFRNELPDLVTAGRASWQRIRENIARSAGNRPGPSAITTGFNPAASADPNSLGEGQTSDPADMHGGYNPASNSGDRAAAPQSQLDEIQEEPEPPSERAPDPATSTPVEEVTWIVDKAVKNTIWRTDTGPLSRERAKQGLSAIQGPLSASGFPPNPTTAKEQLGGRFPGGPLFSDAEWSAFVQLSSTPQGQTWLNASGMLTHEQVEQYLSGNDDDNPERFRGFDKLHNASKVVLASYVSRRMNGGEAGKRFEGTPPAAAAISMEARHTTDPIRRAELKRLIDQGILEEWSKTFEYTQPNEAATTAINKGAVLAPKSLLNTLTFTKGKELSKAEVIKRHGQSLEVLKNVFHLLQEGAEIYDADAKSHVPLQDVPVAKLLSHGGRVNVQIPPSSSPYALTEHLGITDSKGKPKPGVFKRFAGTHHVSFADGEFKEEGGRDAFIKAKLDDTELYGINLAVGGLGLKDFNGDVILPDGAHGHLFIGYRPPKPGRPGALQIGMETTGPNAPSTVGYVHNLGSTEKTANPISSVGGLKQDKIGDESTKNARTVDLGKLGSDWRKTLKDRADRFEQELKQRGKDALTELLGPRTQPPQELQDAQQRSGEPDQAPRDNERRDPPGDAPVDTLAGYNPASDSRDETADPQPQTDEIQEEPEPPSERAPDPATSTPVEEVTWIVDKAVKNTIWRPDTGFLSREKAKRGLPAIAAQLSGGGFPRDPGTAKEQLGGRFSKGQLLSDAEWGAFEQLSSTPQGQSWLNASGMLTLDEIKKYLSGKDEENPERFRGFHQLHKASKVVLASYVSRQMNGGEDGKRFEGTPPAAVAISMEARHTTDPTRKAELKRLIDQGIVEEWSKTLEYTEPNDDANTAIDKGAVLDPKKKLLQQPKKLSKEQVVDRHRQSLDVLKNVFHLLQEGAEIYDDSAKSHVPLKDAPVAKLLSHGGRVNVQVPAGGAPYELTELLGITDKNGNPRPGVFKRSFGTHHVALSDGNFKEEGGHFAAVKSKLDDTELYGINLAVGGLGLKDFNGDVIVPDGAHGHMFIGYRPPRPGRPGALQIGIETTGPGAPSTVGYVHNVFSTEKTANPISSVGGLKQDKIGDDQIKNARTVDLSKLGSDWAKTLRDRAERFEQDLALRGKDALTELVGPRTQPPQELQDAGVGRSGDTLAGAAAPNASPSPTPTTAGGTAQVEPSAQNQEKTLDELLDSIEEQSRAWSHPATVENKRDANQLLTGLLQRQNVNPSIIDRLRELIDNPASLSQSAFTNCALTSILYPTLKNDLATTAHLVAAIFTGKPLGKFADPPRADSSRPQGSGKGTLDESLDLIRRVMTGEVPQALGPAPTRPLVNGLRTAKAKSDSLKRKKDREELERHLLDHLLARGLVELLGPDALEKLQQQTDGAHQPGVAAAQGDLLASANSVASILSSALGANTTVMTRSSPGGYDVTRLNGALRQKDQAGFAIATVMDGKALWSAAKEHEASSTTPDASENVARLGGTATTAPHHATIDGSITDQGDSFLVPLQSWGRTFPVRVNKEDMPKVFAAITYGTALPPRAPSPTASAQEQTLADLQAGHNPDSDSRDETAAPQPQTDEIQDEPEPASERAPDPATSTPVEEVTWIVDKAVKNTIWRPDTGFLSREKAKRGLPAIAAQLSGGGFPRDPGTAKEQLGGRFPKGPLLSDAEWSAFEQLSSTPQGQSWLNASGMLTLDEVKKYLSGKDVDNPERFRGFHQLHKASKVVLASYVSRQMNGGEDGKRFEGTPPAAVAISMEAEHTTDPIRRAELKRLIDQGIVEEWSKTLEYTEPNDDANTAIDKGAVLDPKKKFLQQPKKLSKEQVVDRHRQSLDVLKNVFHLLQEGAEIYDDSAKSHVPLKDAPVAKLLSHGGRVNVQVPAGGAPYELTELLGITDKHGNPATGVFKRSFGTHHVALSDGKFKEQGGALAAVKSKLDDTELYGINLTIGGLGLKDFNGDVIVPDGAHGHMFIGYRPPRDDRPGALQIGIETTGPNAPSTVGYVHNWRSTEKTANPISSVGGLKADKIGDDQIKNARTVDLSKLGSNWAKTLRDRADRFEQDLALRGKDALTELVGPRTQPPQELQDAQQRASEQRADRPEQESRDDDRRDPPGDAPPDTVRSARAPAVDEGSSRGDGRTSPDAPEDMLAGYNPDSDSRDEAADPQPQTDEIEEEPEPPSERAPDPATSTPVEEVTWIVDKAVKNTIWRPDTGFLSREKAKRGLPAIAAQLSGGGFPRDPGTAKEQLGGRFSKGQLLSDAEWSAFEQLSSTPQGQSWLNASGMLTLDEVKKYLSGKDVDNPERFRGFHQLHKASKVVLASYVSRQMNGGEDGKRFEGTPPAAVAISMEAEHTTDPIRRAELKRLIDQGIVEEWSKTLEYTEPNDDANTAIDKGAVLDPKKKLLQQPKKLSKEQVVDRHRQSLDVLKNVFHLLQEGAEIYDDSAKSHVPLKDAPVAKLLSHGGRVNVQVPAGGAPYELTELLGITDKNGNPATGVFKRSFGTHHVALSDGKFKEQGGALAAVKSKLDDTELYGINLTIGGLGLKDFNGDVIVPDGAHGHMFIGYRPPRDDRPGALQIGIETTGPNAPSTVGYVHNWRSTEKTANPISSVGGLKADKIGDDQIKNARTVDLSKLGSDWAKTLRDRADRFEQDLALRGKDALTELVGPRTQPPQELQDAQQRSGEPAQEPRDNDRRDPPGDAAADMLAGYNPASDTGGETAAPQTQLDEIQEEPEPASERAPDPATSTPVEEVTWIVDKAVKNTIWRTDTGPLSRDRAKQGLSAIQGPLSASGFPPDPTTAKEQLGGRFPGGPLFSDAEWSAFVQLSSTPQGQTWLNASGMLTHEQVEQYLSGNDDDNPERFRGFDKLHNASKVVLASYVSRQMNGGEDGKRFEGTPPAAAAISMEARHTTDPIRRAELKRLIDQGIIEEWSKTFEYTQPNEAATTAINKGAVLAPKSLLNTVTFTKGKELSKAEVVKRHGQSLEVLKNVFHLLQEGAEIYDADAKSHVPLQDVPVAKLLSHGGRVNVQIPPSSSPYALTEHLGITDSKGKPRPGVFKRFAGTHHVSFADGEFKEEGGHIAAIKAKLDDTELYGINLAVGGLGLKDFNGDVILPDGAHGHLFIGYRPPKPGRPGALQLGMETTGPNAPSTVGYVHNLRSTEKTANPISSVGGLKRDKIGDESTKNARTVDLGKLGSDWRKTLKDRADRFEQDLKQKGKDALTELLGPRTQPPQELQDAQQRSGEPDQAPRDNEPSDAPAGTAQRTGAPANVLAGYNPALDGESVALDPQSHTDSAQVEPSPRRQDKTLDELLSSLDEQSRAWSGPANDDLRQQAANSLAGLLESLNVDRAIVDRLRELIANPASLSQSAFSNCGISSALYTMLKGDLATTSHLVAALFTGRLLGRFAQAPGARELGAQQDQGKAALSEDLDILRRVMTGEIPRALGPAPTRPLVNGLKTAGAKRGGLTRAADRQQLDRHLLDHLLARGLVELLGQDAVAQHEKRTDDARQPGVVAAEGDLLLSANSIGSLLRNALGAEVEVTSGGPSDDDVGRINETLRRTDRAGFAVATVSNGKALWEAAKQHRDGDSDGDGDATPRAPADVAPLGTGEGQSRHHFAIDGEIKADGDAFIVPVQSWGQSFPIRVQKADMPRLFEVITHGTYPPPLDTSAEQQAPAHLASRGPSGTAQDGADPADLLAGAPANQGEASPARGPAVAPGRPDPGTVQRTPSGLDKALLERVPEHRLNEVTGLVIDTIDSELLPQLLDILPIAQLAATRLAEEIVEKWLTFHPDLLDLPTGELKGRLAAHIELVLGMFERDRGRSTIGRKGGSSAAAPAASASSAPQPPEGTPAPQEELKDRAQESSSSTSSASDTSSDAGAPGMTTEPEGYESLFADLDDLDFGLSPEEHKQKERAARNQEKLEKPARNNDQERAIPEWIWGVPHYAALQTALLAHFDDDAVQRALAELLATTESAETPVPFAEFVAIALEEPRDAESLKQEAVKLFGSYQGETRKLVYDAANALGALDWAEHVPDFDIEALRDPPPPPPTRDEEPPRSVLKRGQEGRWVTRAELEIINRSIGERAFAGMLGRAMNKGKISGTRATIEQLVRQAGRLADPALSPPLTSTSLVVDTNLVEALLTPPRELPLSKRHLREQLDALIREHRITDLRLANINIGELFQHDSIVGRTFTTSDGREIPWYGIRVEGDRRDDTADYALGFEQLASGSVGERKGSADRSMVADAFFSDRESDEDGAPAVPHFATADHGILTPLLSFAGIDAKRRGEKAFIDFVKENSRNGAPYFEPELEGRKLKTHTILNLETAGHAAARDAQPAQSEPIGAAILDTPVGATHRVHDLISLIRAFGFDVYIVGGAVRDALSGKKPKDVDLKTNMPMSRLEEVLRTDPAFESLPVTVVPELRLLQVGGSNTMVDITAGDDTSVQGPLDVMADAQKRDFRMNALYLDENGFVVDPLDGAIEDQLVGRLRFVADPGPTAPVEERQKAVVEHLRRAPWNLGRALKFYQRGYEIEPEILHAVLDNAESILASMKEREAPLHAKSLLLHATRAESPTGLVEIMQVLGFSPQAIREIIPDDVAGRFDDESLAYEHDVLPRWRETPDDDGTGSPLAAPEMKIDLATGRIYQYRFHAIAPQQDGQPGERVIIDVDLGDHNQPGHHAPHYHVYRWRRRDGQLKWDKKKNGFSDTGQPGLPEIADGRYLGPQPWRFEEGLDSDSGDFLDVARRRIREAGIDLSIDGDLLDLGGQVKLHSRRLQELVDRGQFGKLLMLVKNLNSGIPWSSRDQATVDLSGSHRGQERLRFKPQLDLVVPFLRDGGIEDPTSMAIFAENGEMRHDALLRLYDLVSGEERPDLRRPAAEFARQRAESVSEFVERFEFYVASMEGNLSGADVEALWQAQLNAAQEANAAGDVTLRADGELTERLAAAASELRFESASAAAYHAAKHGDEFLTPEERAASVPPEDAIRRYLDTAREAVRKAVQAGALEARTDETGATNIVLWDGTTKVIARVGPDGTAHLLSSYVQDRRNTAPAAAFTRPGAPSSAAATNGVTEPESRGPAERLGAYTPWNGASEGAQGPQAPQASGAPAAVDGTVIDGDVTIRAPIEALVRTLVEKSGAWSSPRTLADKREAIALVTELLQQLGMDAKVVDRGEQGKDAPDDEHSACTCVR
ncbi:hypothetical protein WMF38_38420 [Sorangium sp. So ce118]